MTVRIVLPNGQEIRRRLSSEDLHPHVRNLLAPWIVAYIAGGAQTPEQMVIALHHALHCCAPDASLDIRATLHAAIPRCIDLLLDEKEQAAWVRDIWQQARNDEWWLQQLRSFSTKPAA